MQVQMPIVPEETKLINASTGFRCKDDFVYYLHNGDPIFCHHKADKNNFRYIIANLIETGLCKAGELSKALGVSHRNINRYHKKYREKGAESFFNKRFDGRGNCYKLTDDKKQQAQELLDAGLSNVRVAKQLGVSECTIRYHLKKGTLKKKP
jgi:transposase